MNIDIRMLVILTGITSLIQVIALRDLISIKLITIIAANALIILGPTFIYIGVMRFLDKKENRPIVFSVFAVFLLSFF